MAKTNKKKSSKSKKKQFPVDTASGDPTKIITRAYILALSLIAFLTIGVHMITADITEQQKEGAEIAYKIGRQRTLAQQTVLHASNYYHTGEGLDYDFMMQSLWDLRNGHNYLLGMIAKNNSPALHRVHYKPPFNLNEHIVSFSTMVEQFSKYPAKTQTVEDYSKKRATLVNKLNHTATNILRPAMEAALENYQTEMLEKIAHFYSIQLGGTIFILIVLLAEAVFIFTPMVTKIKEYNATLQRHAMEDSLTGMNNRRAFMNSANTELKKAQREKTAITVALLDLDFFKKVNDTYGHEVGDHVLKHFSAILKTAFRAGDIIGRIGGEEFAVLLPKIDRDGAIHILQRLCDKIANTPCEYKRSDGATAELNYTVSIGFTGPSLIDKQTIDGLLAQADEGLYTAKEQGRNCVVSAQKT